MMLSVVVNTSCLCNGVGDNGGSDSSNKGGRDDQGGDGSYSLGENLGCIDGNGVDGGNSDVSDSHRVVGNSGRGGSGNDGNSPGDVVPSLYSNNLSNCSL